MSEPASTAPTTTAPAPAVVLCQSENCANGKPPAHLECPTCHKYVAAVVTLFSRVLTRLDQAWNHRVFFLRTDMLQTEL